MNVDLNVISELVGALEWPKFLLDGDCTGMDPTIFDDEDRKKTVRAKKVCNGCPVQMLCADWAIANEPSGVWGGLDSKDLAKARRGKRKFVTLEKRREDLEWVQDMCSDKPAYDLAIKYEKTERTIYRWREKERKRARKLGWAS